MISYVILTSTDNDVIESRQMTRFYDDHTLNTDVCVCVCGGGGGGGECPRPTKVKICPA